jgi:outer membrane protein assembly factor BamE (lipoprotein component of BamABCDE complex)
MNLKSSGFKLSLILLAILTGCASYDNRGHYVEPEQLAKIQVGITTKEQVAELIGTPSSVSPFGDKTWFYMSETTQKRAFLSPRVLKSNVTRIEFDDQGRVTVLDSLTEQDKQVVAHVNRSTPTSGYSDSILKQLFGNVGRFNGKDPDSDRGR